MRKFRKTAAVALAAMMAFSVTGCGGGAKETTAAAAADTTAAGTEAEKVSEAVTEAAKEEGKKIEDMGRRRTSAWKEEHISGVLPILRYERERMKRRRQEK